MVGYNTTYDYSYATGEYSIATGPENMEYHFDCIIEELPRNLLELDIINIEVAHTMERILFPGPNEEDLRGVLKYLERELNIRDIYISRQRDHREMRDLIRIRCSVRIPTRSVIQQDPYQAAVEKICEEAEPEEPKCKSIW